MLFTPILLPWFAWHRSSCQVQIPDCTVNYLLLLLNKLESKWEIWLGEKTTNDLAIFFHIELDGHIKILFSLFRSQKCKHISQIKNKC